MEIGVLDGGSLLMWRKYFGENARIVGIEKNPKALEIKKLGFEIYIADQESPKDLKNVLEELGEIDILIDDGSHTSLVQINTCLASVTFIKDNGLIIIEDTHSSFAKDFGNVYKYSFAYWTSKVSSYLDKQYLIERKISYQKNLNIRSSETLKFAKKIAYIQKFRSMTVFKVKNNLSNPKLFFNNQVGRNSKDERWKNLKILSFLKKLENFFRLELFFCRKYAQISKYF